MKNIILLTDFSDTARNAALYALKLFEHADAHFTLLNAYDIEFSGTPYIVQVKEELAAESVEKLNSDLFFLQKRMPEAKIKIVSCFGSLVDAVRTELETSSYDIVVMGCKGESAVEYFLLGSNTYEVIKHVKAPLLVVPGHISYRRPERITFATDMKSMENEEMMKPLLSIASKCGSEMLFVNVLGAEYVNRLQVEQQLASYLKGVRISFHFVEGEDIRKAILDFMEEHDSNFATLVRHDLKFLDRLFKPSFTKQMVLKPQHPMLILRDKMN